MKRGHTPKESKVLNQQLPEVEMKDREVAAERESWIGSVCGKGRHVRDWTKVKPIQL